MHPNWLVQFKMLVLTGTAVAGLSRVDTSARADANWTIGFARTAVNWTVKVTASGPNALDAANAPVVVAPPPVCASPVVCMPRVQYESTYGMSVLPVPRESAQPSSDYVRTGLDRNGADNPNGIPFRNALALQDLQARGANRNDSPLNAQYNDLKMAARYGLTPWAYAARMNLVAYGRNAAAAIPTQPPRPMDGQ